MALLSTPTETGTTLSPQSAWFAFSRGYKAEMERTPYPASPGEVPHSGAGHGVYSKVPVNPWSADVERADFWEWGKLFAIETKENRKERSCL